MAQSTSGLLTIRQNQVHHKQFAFDKRIVKNGRGAKSRMPVFFMERKAGCYFAHKKKFFLRYFPKWAFYFIAGMIK